MFACDRQANNAKPLSFQQFPHGARKQLSDLFM